MAERRKTVSDQVKETLGNAMTKTRLAKLLNISSPTLYDRLDTNGWKDDEIVKLKEFGVIKNVGSNTNR